MILAIGKNEKSDKTVSIRRIGSTDTEVLDLKTAVKIINSENPIENRNAFVKKAPLAIPNRVAFNDKTC